MISKERWMKLAGLSGPENTGNTLQESSFHHAADDLASDAANAAANAVLQKIKDHIQEDEIEVYRDEIYNFVKQFLQSTL